MLLHYAILINNSSYEVLFSGHLFKTSYSYRPVMFADYLQKYSWSVDMARTREWGNDVAEALGRGGKVPTQASPTVLRDLVPLNDAICSSVDATHSSPIQSLSSALFAVTWSVRTILFPNHQYHRVISLPLQLEHESFFTGFQHISHHKYFWSPKFGGSASL